jgi:hypothetical protein
MKRLERRGAFYVACMAVLVVVMLLIHWSLLFWTAWVWIEGKPIRVTRGKWVGLFVLAGSRLRAVNSDN